MFKILKNCLLTHYANQTFLTSGMDSPEEQLRRSGSVEWFNNYPHEVIYNYNSRGYRDAEWPETIEELQRSIWCMGDSFTAGLGANYTHIWPYILQEKTETRTINVSMDGASNTWIATRACDVLREIKPQHMIIHWSYTHRREQQRPVDAEEDQIDSMKLRLMHDNTSPEEDAVDILKRITMVEEMKNTTNVIHSFIPNFHNDISSLQERIIHAFPDAKIIPVFQQLDIARDLHHYGKITADNFVDSIMKLM